MQSEQLKQRIKELIAEGHPEQALQLLKQQGYHYLDKDITLLESRLSDLKRDRMQGVSEPAEEKRERARINRDIIDLLERIKKTPTGDSKQANHLRRNLIIGASVIIIGVLGFVMAKNFSKPAPEPVDMVPVSKPVDLVCSLPVPFPGKTATITLMDSLELDALKFALFQQSFPSQSEAMDFVKDHNLPNDIAAFHLQKNGALINFENGEEIKTILDLGIGQYDTLSLFELDTIQPPRPGTMDKEFGKDGITNIIFKDKNHFLKSISILPNDKILVVGSASGNLAMAMLDRNGNLDPKFGDAGVNMTDVAFDIIASGDAAVQPKGQIVFSGNSPNLPYTQRSNAFSVRYLLDGKNRDKSFGKGVQVPSPNHYGYSWNFEVGRDEWAYSLGMNEDGGFAQTGINAKSRHLFVSTFDKDGKPNTGFRDKGYNVYKTDDSESMGEGLIYLQDGKMLIAGSTGIIRSDCKSMLMRIHPNGEIDNSFGINGKVVIENQTEKVRANFYALEIQKDGKILCLGRRIINSQNTEEPILMRFGPNGRIDDSFGKNGAAIFPDGSQTLSGNSFYLQPDGKILVVGKTPSIKHGKSVITIVRFNPNGKAESNFGENGIIKLENIRVREQSFISMQKDGKIIVAGTATDNSHFAVARIESGYYPEN